MDNRDLLTLIFLGFFSIDFFISLLFGLRVEYLNKIANERFEVYKQMYDFFMSVKKSNKKSFFQGINIGKK